MIMRLVSIAVAGSILLGCSFDIGAAGGMTTRHARAVLSDRVSASTRLGSPINNSGPLIGAAIEGRSEAYEGSGFNGGVMAGYGYGPAGIGGLPIGWDLYVEAGTPFHDTMFRRGAFYAGVTGDLPIRLSASRNIRDLNESTWILYSRFEIVPMLRARFYSDHDPDLERELDIQVGIAIRTRLYNDLF